MADIPTMTTFPKRGRIEAVKLRKSHAAFVRGGRLRELRKEQKLSQVELAVATGVSRSTIGSIESGNDMAGRETNEAFSAFFHVSVDYLQGAVDHIRGHRRLPFPYVNIKRTY